jgi:hypothetical protein
MPVKQPSHRKVGEIGSGVERLKRKTEELQRERSWVKKVTRKKGRKEGKKKNNRGCTNWASTFREDEVESGKKKERKEESK